MVLKKYQSFDWKFSRRLVSICEHIRNSTPYTLYENDNTEGTLSNRGSGIPGIILRFEKLNFETIDFYYPLIIL